MPHPEREAPLVWTAAPDPWRRLRRSAAGLVCASLLAWVAWLIVQHLPPITFQATKAPTIAHAQPATAPAPVIEEQPVAAPAVPVAPPPPRGPVIRTVPD
jgi:hypothetical protein